MHQKTPLARGLAFLHATGVGASLALAGLLLIAASARGQSTTEIVRGKITGVDGKPIPQVSVTITGLLTQTSLNVPTNDKGIYTALFPNGEGDYLVNIRKIGFAPYNTRVTRTGLSTVLVADVTLKELAFQLDTINVAAKRLLPGADQTSVGGITNDLLSGALFSLDPSDLIALAAQIPGVLSSGDSAFSVLGSGNNANASTLDGAKFNGGNVPPDMISGSRLVQTSADPGVGNFSGGLTQSIARGGTDLFAMTARGTFADHHTAWADPAWPRPIAQIGTTSGTIGGPIVKKRLHYQGSWNVRDNESDVFSLLDPPQSIISQYGLVGDTISAISSALHQLGVPATAGGLSSSNHGRSYNSSLVLDWTPKGTTALRITQSGFWGNNSSPGAAPYSYPSQGQSSSNNFQFVTAKLTGYVHGFLDELNTTLNYSNFSSDPFLQLPSASVRVGTVYDDGHTGLGTVSFGGGSGVNRSTSYDLEARNEFSWIAGSGKHRIKIGQDVDQSWNSNYSSGNQFGSYTYQTLADLEANRPASYNLTLSSFERSSHGAEVSAWIGDEWSASKAWQFQGGLRYDAAIPGTVPLLNPAVQQEFGLETDRIPHSRLFTPRLGFSWASAKRRGMGSSSGQNGPIALGNLPANLPPEFIQALLGTPRGSTAPGWAVTGSIGAYGSPLDNGNIASLIDQTGLPDTRRVLNCVGDVTPIPDWNAITNAPPTSCIGGGGVSTFASDAPSIQVFDPTFKAQVSWRANLGIDGIRLPKKWTLGLTSFFNYGVNARSSIDENLTQTPAFTLGNEANRQVYVNPSDIVPETGVIAPNAYRIDPLYGPVRDVLSDLHTRTAQFQATIAPPHALLHNKLQLSMTYVYNHTDREQRGMDGGGFGGPSGFSVVNGQFFSFGGSSFAIGGNPFTKAWVSGNQPTHQIVTTASLRAWWFNISTRLTMFSGTPFTPSVAGDVNGDGLNDDLAFIPNPATTHDPALAAQMTQLLAAAPAGARDCLMKQLGEIAGINSCTTQWQARLDLRIDWQPPRSFGFGDRLRLTTQMINTSGALVRLFGLENTALGRGALSQTANSQLLYVTGFDPSTQNYKYQVNQLFGQPLNFGTARHLYPPFQLQMGLEYKLGGPPTAPMALSMGLIPGAKEPPYTMDQIRAKLERLSRDPVQAILVRRDSMALSPQVVTQLESISKDFRARVDSALDPAMEYVMKKGRKIDDQQLNSRLGRAQPQIQRMLADANTHARALLTPAQLRMLPATPMPGGLTPRSAPGGSAGSATSAPDGVRAIKIGGGGD
ncbi:MAG TPA: carboxypeptidase regulatory-like domain-containing protein [Gemmatimonadales bacterium]|jgi:hypothetical protein